MKVGIFAGTFDPVHNGHIMLAQGAIGECGLDKVVFLPERQPRHKRGVTPFAHRVAMLQRIVADQPRFEVLEAADDHFTVASTLPMLQKIYPGSALFLLLGSDVATHMAQWPDIAQLFDGMQLAVGMRQGDTAPQLPVPACYVHTPHSHVAASHIRSGQSAEVPAVVRDYIAAHRLYGVQ